MNDYKIEFYEKVDGSIPVKDFLETLPPNLFAKVARNINILKDFNINLREPLAKHLENGIFELRTQLGNNNVRGLYFFFDGQKIILTNGFMKTTNKTPRKYIDTAVSYREDYFNRS